MYKNKSKYIFCTNCGKCGHQNKTVLSQLQVMNYTI